jgi:hypothetical protein
MKTLCPGLYSTWGGGNAELRVREGIVISWQYRSLGTLPIAICEITTNIIVSIGLIDWVGTT